MKLSLISKIIVQIHRLSTNVPLKRGSKKHDPFKREENRKPASVLDFNSAHPTMDSVDFTFHYVSTF